MTEGAQLAMNDEDRAKFAAEGARRLEEVMKDALPGDLISSFDTFPASYVNVSKMERERAAQHDQKEI
jgi:hypothetical protein